MTTATIVNLLTYGAVLDDGGIPEIWPDWRAAADQADARGIAWVLKPSREDVVEDDALEAGAGA